MRSPISRALAALGALLAVPAAATAQQVVTLDNPSPLVEIRIMVKAGSTADPAGKEGLAALTARSLLQGGFGDAADPVTKEELSEITRPWGSGAQPGVLVEKETSTFVMTVPADVLDRYLATVLRPLFTEPLFAQDQVERLRNEQSTQVSNSLRFENIEGLGLEALDQFVLEGTSYAHPVSGTVQGLKTLTRDDVRAFYAQFYKPGNIILGISSAKPGIVNPIKAALAGAGTMAGVPRLAFRAPSAPKAIDGREMVVVSTPGAGATGLHAGFPLEIDRSDAEFWPLYVANVHLGTHRDSHGQLYELIRSQRGYNYGNYSYIEHFAARPNTLFPPFNTPRKQQYFSLWIRPVAAEYAPHLTKAMTFELENLIRTGLTQEEFELSRNKAKTLYLNLAETTSRLLAAKMDDAYYGMSPGYLEGYLKRLDAVTLPQVNAAIRENLQARNMKYVVIADEKEARDVAAAVRRGGVAWGKNLVDYQIEVDSSGPVPVYRVPENRLDLIRRDALWANYPLQLPAHRVYLVPVTSLFETGGVPRKPAGPAPTPASTQR